MWKILIQILTNWRAENPRDRNWMLCNDPLPSRDCVCIELIDGVKHIRRVVTWEYMDTVEPWALRHFIDGIAKQLERGK